MGLVPNTFSKSVFDGGPPQDDWTEGMGSVAVEVGWYKNPTLPDEEIMIERTKTVTNQLGTEIRRDEERWEYDVPGAPPIRYDHTIYSRVFLPGLGRALRKVQEETHYFWAFSPLTDGDNLGRTRVVNAYVVYDTPEDPTKNATGEQLAKVAEAGYQGGTFADRLLSSGKLWSDAQFSEMIVQEEGHPQATKWIEGVIMEHEMVEEEFDKWTIWNAKKDALRSAGVEWEGPKYIRKESYRYKLPVPLQPPTIAAGATADGINIEITGGGAEINNTYFGPSGTFYVRPEKYHVYRKIVTEPDRSEDPNLYGWWDTPPAAEGRRSILTNTDVTDFAGAPASALPSQEGWSEPHDPDPEDQPPEAEFRRIATVDNTMGKDDEGYAEFLDTDCEDTAEYEYYATAVYHTQESTDSNHETVTFSGTGSRSYRIIDGDDAVDAIAPDDPLYPELDFGEVLEFDLPAEDPYDYAEEIADRQFAANRSQDFRIRLTVLHPLLGLEWGQRIGLPNVQWDTYANALHLETETDSDEWMLVGFQRNIQRTPDGKWRSPETTLTLGERPKPQ
jgi:hypothetical protein